MLPSVGIPATASLASLDSIGGLQNYMHPSLHHAIGAEKKHVA